MSAAVPSPRAGDGPVSEAVQLAGVGKTFRGRTDVTALADIDLAVEAGEFVTFIGPSGCGKSTLLRLIADLIEPTAGTVTVNGKSARQARLDQDYGIAFQQAGLMEWRTVARNVELPLELRGWDRARRRAHADQRGFAGRPGARRGAHRQSVRRAQRCAARPDAAGARLTARARSIASFDRRSYLDAKRRYFACP